jgi:hypothetical protein
MELADHPGLTRQAIDLHLRRLIDSGEIIKTGPTRGARYFPASAVSEPEVFAGQFNLQGVDEAKV